MTTRLNTGFTYAMLKVPLSLYPVINTSTQFRAGIAPPNTPTSSASWQIMNVDLTTLKITYAQDGDFLYILDNHNSYTYG